MDGIREFSLRNFFLGEKTAGYRGRAGKIESVRIRNMFIDRADGSLKNRHGHLLLDTGNTSGAFGITVRRLMQFNRRNDPGTEATDPVLMAHIVSQGTVAQYSGGSNYSTIRSGLGGTGTFG